MVYQRRITQYYRKRKRSAASGPPAKRRRTIARLRRLNRKFYKRRAFRRRRRRIPLWRRGNRYDTEVFRTGPKEILSIAALATEKWNFAASLDELVQDPTVLRMTTNKAIHYEQFKLSKVYCKVWIENTGLENQDTFKKPDFVMSYDPDDRTITDFHLISSRPNSKFKRWDIEKTHTFRLRPRFPTDVKLLTAPVTSISSYRSTRHDNPWFDTADFNNATNLQKFEPTNCIKCAMFNPNSTDIKIRGYFVYVMKWRFHKRQTT